MIPWPSSRYDRRWAEAAAATNKELKIVRNQSGHIKNLLERQAKELKEQRQLLESLVDAMKVQRDMSNAEPMYVFTGET